MRHVPSIPRHPARVARAARRAVPESRLHAAWLLAALMALACARLAGAESTPAPPSGAESSSAAPAFPSATEVRVERVRPSKEKHPTLRFLKENRAFIRARFDLLRQQPIDRRGAAAAIDPRFLAYQEMLRDILASGDSVTAAADARQRQQLLASINDLGQIEARLDRMERLLAEQRTRLGILQEDFTGDQKTALLIVLRGHPQGTVPERVMLRIEDGDTLSIALTPEQRQSLEQGGVVQIFHGFVEPRAQVFEIALGGEGWPADPGFLTLEPARDRLTFLELDLSALRPELGAGAIQARTWLHDSRLPRGDG